MGLKQDLTAARETVGAVLHNTNTALADYGIAPLGTLAALPEALDTVYERGAAVGNHRFWEAYQSGGNRKDYSNAFSGDGWNEDTFTPLYDIRVVGSGLNLFSNIKISNLTETLAKYRVTLDTSGATTLNYAFCSDTIARVPTVSTVSVSKLHGVFWWSHHLQQIDRLVLKEDGSQVFESTFDGCTALTEIRVEGTVGESINLQWSPLTVESMKSIISCLKNYAGTPQQGTKTVRFSDSRWAALEADSVAPDGGTWRNYVVSVLGWSM